MLKKFKIILIVGFSIILQSCASTELSMNGLNNNSKYKSKLLELAQEGQNNLDKGYYDLASKNFNDALKTNIQNAKLQTLNAIAYHLSAQSSDATKYNLA